MKKIGIRLADLQEKIDNGKRSEWAMRWVEKHTDHYADRGRTIAVVPLEAWNKVLNASGEPPKQSPDFG